jgi:hypothetical protein
MVKMGWISSVISGVIGVIAEPIKEWQKRKTLEVKQEDEQLKRQHELNLKKIDVAYELAKQGQKIEADWDTNAQMQMKYTWKDEYLMLLLSVPMVMAFVPSLAPYVEEGFKVLQKTPDWYMLSFIGIVAATFGLRWLLGKVKR